MTIGALPVVSVRADRRFVRKRFKGFRLTVRMSGEIVEQVETGTDLERVEAERNRLRAKWEYEATR